MADSDTTDYGDTEKDYGPVSRVARRLYPEAWKVSSAVPHGDGYARRQSLLEAVRAINVVLEECYGTSANAK